MTLSNKIKLCKFLENAENKMLIICLVSMLSYLMVWLIVKNMYILLFSYAIFYWSYSKLYGYLLEKLHFSINVCTDEDVEEYKDKGVDDDG